MDFCYKKLTQASLAEPNSGKTTYQYNPFGELVQQTDNRQNTYVMHYDKLGRLTKKKLAGTSDSTTYYYNDTAPRETGKGFGLLQKTEGSNGFSYEYNYDELSRLDSVTETHTTAQGALVYTSRYVYDDNSGQLSEFTYPTGFKIGYEYNDNGNILKQVKTLGDNSVIWENLGINQRGQITDYALGNGLSTHKAYDEYGFPTEIITGNVQHLGYNFDPMTGNLNWRSDSLFGLKESFEYDNVLKSRLMSWQVNGLQQYRARFDDNGNITQKTDVSTMGFYTYDQTRQHAVTEISEPTSAYLSVAASPQQISYTAFNKAESIMEDNSLPGSDIKLDRLDITYGPDNMRKITELYLNNNLRKTKHFIGGNYEEERKTDGSMRKLHYISGGDGVCAIYVQNGTNDTMYYIQKDHLGSYYCVTGEDGAVILLNDREEQIYSFDPWGRRRSPQTWDYTGIQTEFLFDRGFTGHEHLDKFNLINMNGRVYDPWVGRFLSPDIFVQAPGYSQSHNRYSYVFNNPLKYVDPTGYEGGPHGNPLPYAYGEGSASPGMGFYAFKAMPWGQGNRVNFMNSGFAQIDAMYHQDKARAVIRELWENSTMSTFSGVEAREIFTMMKLGFDFKIVEAFGTAVLVMAQGELGEIQYGENGGIDFANETAGVYFGTAVVGGGDVDFGGYSITSQELKDNLFSLSIYIATQQGTDLQTIVVSSGDRSASRNKALGGATRSRHIVGDAADIYVIGISNRQLSIYAHESGLFNTTIFYPQLNATGALSPHVHLDLRPRTSPVLLIYNPTIKNGTVIKHGYKLFTY